MGLFLLESGGELLMESGAALLLESGSALPPIMDVFPDPFAATSSGRVDPFAATSRILGS